jgi:5'-methylthioadenosine nucleosidase
MAMLAEAKPIISSLNLVKVGKVNKNLPMELYSGVYKGKVVNLLLNGKCSTHGVDHIGTQAATLGAHLGIEKFSPNMVINAGTAGGFLHDGASVGDVYLSHPIVCFHDRRINLPNFKEYGIGNYPCYPSTNLAKELGLKLGVVSTGNSLDFNTFDKNLMKSYNGVVKDMEAAAIAWVAQLYSTPFIAIKAITDIVDGDIPTEEEFLLNLSEASKKLGEKTLELLAII